MNYIKRHYKLLLSIIVPAFAAGITVLVLVLIQPQKVTVVARTASTQTASPSQTATVPVAAPTTTISGLQLDTSKKYGNKYANGILPVGDSKYVTSNPKAGYVLSCTASMNGGGASVRGPWFTNNNTEYDISKKVSVNGSLSWKGNYTMVINGVSRIVTTNDLPINHTTGVFPIASSDSAYLYDKNPNAITSQSFVYTLPATPTIQTSPGCIGMGAIAVMTTGVALFNAFDAGGRDAGAWEVQDSCGGHPQPEGQYHYHSLSSCITDIGVQTVIGYAIDGYPITGPTIAAGNILTTSDLDECHGIVSQINLDGKLVPSYHYVMTQDFPYSISCYHGAPTVTPGVSSGQQSLPPKP